MRLLRREDAEVLGTTPEEPATEEHSFDELAKELASGTISRWQALRLLGGTLLGTVLDSLSWTRRGPGASGDVDVGASSVRAP